HELHIDEHGSVLGHDIDDFRLKVIEMLRLEAQAEFDAFEIGLGDAVAAVANRLLDLFQMAGHAITAADEFEAEARAGNRDAVSLRLEGDAAAEEQGVESRPGAPLAVVAALSLETKIVEDGVYADVEFLAVADAQLYSFPS